MIATPGEPDLPVPVPKSFHEQTDEELTVTDIKRIDADDQAIQTILFGLPEYVYAALDSCEIAKEIWERVRQMMKASDIKEHEKKAKLFNEWEKFTSTDGESIESYYHHFMQLMNDLKRNKHFSENIASNLKFLNNLQPEWKTHVTIVRQTKNLHEANFTQIYDFLKMNHRETSLRFAKEKLCQIQKSLHFVSKVVAICLKTRCVLSQNSLRIVSKLITFFLKTRYVLSQDSLRFVSRLAGFCLKTRCVLSKDSLRFVSRLSAFCLKTRCVLPQDSLRFALRLAAFCLKTRCVLSQNLLRFASKLAAFCLKIAGLCLKTYCVLPQNSLRFVSRLAAFCLKNRCIFSIEICLSYARSRPNGKMIVDSIKNGPYVRRMIATLREPDLPISVLESFHEQTDEELIETDIKRMDADDQAIQTIVLGLPEDVYAAVDSCEIAKEIWEREEVNELKAERLAKSHDPLALMAHSQNSFNFPTTHKDPSSSSTHLQQSFPINNKYNPQPSLNQNFMQPPMTSLEDINDPTKAMNAALILFAKAFQLSVLTNNNQMTSSNPRNHQIAQPNQQGFNAWQNGGIQGAQNVGVQSGGNQNGLVVVRGIANQSGTGNVVAARAVGDLDDIKEVNGNCILMANLQQASTSGTQHEKAPVYDTDGSAEVHLNENCYDNEIFNMFTQEEQYTDLLEPVPEPQPVPQNDSHVTSVAPSIVQSGGTVETSFSPIEETRAYQESVYRNLVDQVAHVNMEKYDKLEKCYQKSVYQEHCLTRKINALHLSSAKQISTLNDEISNVNKQLSKEKSSISSLMDEKKRLKHDFKIQKDKFLDKKVDLEAKIKDLENILLKRDQIIYTIHMLNPKPDLFYHSNQKMALGYPNPSYLKKAQLKQQSLYNDNLLLEEHDPPTVYDSEETLELAKESREK
uniref:Gag-Pol polyprotein n=1 Tax=Tanacetum cinerariifolium TaxID=118510 RepID=A0A699I2D6_TANCI|nr:hypothetical protein [Tanacetum cinerariifolium]